MQSASDLVHFCLWFSLHTSSCSQRESFWFRRVDMLNMVTACCVSGMIKEAIEKKLKGGIKSDYL